IGARSEPGKGSEFWCRCVFEKAVADLDGSVSPLPSFAGQRIVAVTDNPTTGTILREMLQGFGLKVEICRRSDEILPLLAGARQEGGRIAGVIFDEDVD